MSIPSTSRPREQGCDVALSTGAACRRRTEDANHRARRADRRLDPRPTNGTAYNALDIGFHLTSFSYVLLLHLVTPPQHRNPLGGLTDGAIINTLKRLLSAARNIENGGSLSIYASATEYLFVGEQTIHAITNWELALQESASHSSGASAFEISDSYALHTGDLVSPTVAAGTDALRVLLNDAEEGASLPEWLNPNASRKVFELLQDTADNDQFLVKLAQKLA